MQRILGAGAIALALVASNAGAAVIATEILPISIILSDAKQNLTGSNSAVLTFSATQQFTVPRIDPSVDLASLAASLSFRVDFDYAVSQFGGTSDQGILFRPSGVRLRAYAGPAATGTPVLVSNSQGLLNTVLCFGQADGSPCIDSEMGAIDRTDQEMVGPGSVLDLFQGSGDTAITVELSFLAELLYDSSAAQAVPRFAYAYDFEATGELKLVFEGEGPEGVPAPAGAGLLGLGFAALAVTRRRRVSAASAS